MGKKFISFNNDSKKSITSTENSFKSIQEATLKTAIAFSKRSSFLLENIVLAKDEQQIQKTIEDISALQGLLEGYIDLLTKPNSDDVEVKVNERQLENGGLAPPVLKTWEKVNLTLSEEQKLLQEIRNMKHKGESFSPNLFPKIPVSIEEFTNPFRYLEEIRDYNGAFLVNLLKSEKEILEYENKFNLNLQLELKECKLGKSLILDIYDIPGSISKGEEKRFSFILGFNPLNGELFNLYPKSKTELSPRQKEEIIKFCKVKKIVYTA